MVTVTIMHLEVGYESTKEDTFCNSSPPMKHVLMELIPKGKRDPWNTPSNYTIPSTFKDDTWVSHYLQERFNAALGDKTLLIEEKHLRRYPSATRTLNASSSTGSPGTRCKLRGEQWINSRSYVLMTPEGEQWPADRDPVDAVVFATLTWLCTQTTEASLQSGQRT